MRHLVCVPYSVSNLHRMAEILGIKRCWYHSSSRHKHYDIPKRRIEEVTARCIKVSGRQILRICKGWHPDGVEAQVEERCAVTAEVAGSIPAHPTNEEAREQKQAD